MGKDASTPQTGRLAPLPLENRTPHDPRLSATQDR